MRDGPLCHRPPGAHRPSRTHAANRMALNGLHPVQIGFPTRVPELWSRGPPWRGHRNETDTHTHIYGLNIPSRAAGAKVASSLKKFSANNRAPPLARPPQPVRSRRGNEAVVEASPDCRFESPLRVGADRYLVYYHGRVDADVRRHRASNLIPQLPTLPRPFPLWRISSSARFSPCPNRSYRNRPLKWPSATVFPPSSGTSSCVQRPQNPSAASLKPARPRGIS